MEATTKTKLRIPEALFKLLSKAAVANGRTMDEEIISRLAARLDRDDTETNRQH